MCAGRARAARKSKKRAGESSRQCAGVCVGAGRQHEREMDESANERRDGGDEERRPCLSQSLPACPVPGKTLPHAKMHVSGMFHA